jgi:hypothetical protein
MRVANSCLIWKLWVNKGTIHVLVSLVIINMRDGCTSIGLLRDKTSLGGDNSCGAISVNNM